MNMRPFTDAAWGGRDWSLPINPTHKIIQMYDALIKYRCTKCRKFAYDVTFGYDPRHQLSICDECMECIGPPTPIHIDAYSDLIVIHYRTGCNGSNLCLKLIKI